MLCFQLLVSRICLPLILVPCVARAIKLQFPPAIHSDDTVSFSWSTSTGDPPYFALIVSGNDTQPASAKRTLVLQTKYQTDLRKGTIHIPDFSDSLTSCRVTVLGEFDATNATYLYGFDVAVAPKGQAIPPVTSHTRGTTSPTSSVDNIPQDTGRPSVAPLTSSHPATAPIAANSTVTPSPSNSNSASWDSGEQPWFTYSTSSPISAPGTDSTSTSQPTAAQSPHRRQLIGPIIGGVLGGLVLFALLIVIFILCQRPRNRQAIAVPFNSEVAPAQSQIRLMQTRNEKETREEVSELSSNTSDSSSTRVTLPHVLNAAPENREAAILQEIAQLRLYVVGLAAQQRELGNAENDLEAPPGYSSQASEPSTV